MANRKFMTGPQYIEAVETSGFNLRSFGIFMRLGANTSYRYAYKHSRIPGPTADLLRLLAAGKITTKEIEAIRIKHENK